ncbi:Camk protein kinase [Globisporangium polare]
MACLSYQSVVPPSTSGFRFHHKAPARPSSSNFTQSQPPPPPPPSQPRKNPYRVVKELGSGLQGRVVLALDQDESKHVAVKIPSAFSNDDSEFDARLLDYQVQSILRERRAQRLVSHENVLKFLRLVPGKKRDVQYAAMVMEYAPNGDFFDIIADTGALSESVAKVYFQQLLSGIQACHAAGVVHRDIKPENMLLDEHFTLKICDFGLAHVASARGFYRNANKSMLRDVSGTALYMAPEVQNQTPFRATPLDVWSAGVVLFILLTSFPPFQHAKKGDCWYDCVVGGRMDVFWDAQRECAEAMSGDAKDLITGLLCADPEQRLTVAQALQHPWLRDTHLVDRRELLSEMRERREYSQSSPKTG